MANEPEKAENTKADDYTVAGEVSKFPGEIAGGFVDLVQDIMGGGPRESQTK